MAKISTYTSKKRSKLPTSSGFSPASIRASSGGSGIGQELLKIGETFLNMGSERRIYKTAGAASTKLVAMLSQKGFYQDFERDTLDVSTMMLEKGEWGAALKTFGNKYDIDFGRGKSAGQAFELTLAQVNARQEQRNTDAIGYLKSRPGVMESLEGMSETDPLYHETLKTYAEIYNLPLPSGGFDKNFILGKSAEYDSSTNKPLFFEQLKQEYGPELAVDIQNYMAGLPPEERTFSSVDDFITTGSQSLINIALRDSQFIGPEAQQNRKVQVTNFDKKPDGGDYGPTDKLTALTYKLMFEGDGGWGDSQGFLQTLYGSDPKHDAAWKRKFEDMLLYFKGQGLENQEAYDKVYNLIRQDKELYNTEENEYLFMIDTNFTRKKYGANFDKKLNDLLGQFSNDDYKAKIRDYLKKRGDYKLQRYDQGETEGLSKGAIEEIDEQGDKERFLDNRLVATDDMKKGLALQWRDETGRWMDRVNIYGEQLYISFEEINSGDITKHLHPEGTPWPFRQGDSWDQSDFRIVEEWERENKE